MGTATDSREDQNGRPWPLTAAERRKERRIRMQIDGHPARRPDPAGRIVAVYAAEPASAALAEVARRHHVGEIVVGSRGMGRVRAAMSSVSHRLLRIADRPVVVVPKLRSRAPAHTRHA
jgi:nucleotide-binding universal stress UspA family protein